MKCWPRCLKYVGSYCLTTVLSPATWCLVAEIYGLSSAFHACTEEKEEKKYVEFGTLAAFDRGCDVLPSNSRLEWHCLTQVATKNNFVFCRLSKYKGSETPKLCGRCARRVERLLGGCDKHQVDQRRSCKFEQDAPKGKAIYKETS